MKYIYKMFYFKIEFLKYFFLFIYLLFHSCNLPSKQVFCHRHYHRFVNKFKNSETLLATICISWKDLCKRTILLFILQVVVVYTKVSAERSGQVDLLACLKFLKWALSALSLRTSLGAEFPGTFEFCEVSLSCLIASWHSLVELLGRWMWCFRLEASFSPPTLVLIPWQTQRKSGSTERQVESNSNGRKTGRWVGGWVGACWWERNILYHNVFLPAGFTVHERASYN